MAKLPQGLLGPISGKLGPIVGATWNGIPYLRTAPQKSTKPLTAAQLNNIEKFKFLNHFLTPFHAYLGVGLKNQAIRMTALNAGYSLNAKNLLTGASPNFIVNYEKLIWSKGLLPMLVNLQAQTIAHGKLQLSWAAQAKKDAAPQDQMMLLVYCPDLHYTDGFIGGVSRQDQQCSFQINPMMLGKPIQVYMAATSLDRKQIANNQYLGEFLGI